MVGESDLDSEESETFDFPALRSVKNPLFTWFWTILKEFDFQLNLTQKLAMSKFDVSEIGQFRCINGIKKSETSIIVEKSETRKSWGKNRNWQFLTDSRPIHKQGGYAEMWKFRNIGDLKGWLRSMRNRWFCYGKIKCVQMKSLVTTCLFYQECSQSETWSISAISSIWRNFHFPDHINRKVKYIKYSFGNQFFVKNQSFLRTNSDSESVIFGPKKWSEVEKLIFQAGLDWELKFWFWANQAWYAN